MDHPEKTTPPLSPMYSSDGQSIQVSLSSKGGRVQVSYTKPSSMTSMETHWEEINQNEKYADRKSDKMKKQTDKASIDDDTESELIAIPESDVSDSTLQGSVQDSFDEGEFICMSSNYVPLQHSVGPLMKTSYLCWFTFAIDNVLVYHSLKDCERNLLITFFENCDFYVIKFLH